MGDMVLTRTRIQAGVYEGVLEADLPAGAAPPVMALFDNTPLEGLSLTADAEMGGKWAVRLPIPTALMADGIQTFALVHSETKALLDSFTIITGAPLEDDLRAELALVRAELDMLKKAFRRHCVETG